VFFFDRGLALALALAVGLGLVVAATLIVSSDDDVPPPQGQANAASKPSRTQSNAAFSKPILEAFESVDTSGDWNLIGNFFARTQPSKGDFPNRLAPLHISTARLSFFLGSSPF
jgi:hypothetical protein